MTTRRLLTSLPLLLVAACGADVGGFDPPDAGPGPVDARVCVGNTAPSAPTILQPEAGRIDVLGDDLVIEVSDYLDVDGDAVVAAVVEIYELDGDGSADHRVWSATIADPMPGLAVTLADGAFVDGSIALGEWVDYAVRAYYVDDHDGCGLDGEPSPVRTFRTDDGSTALFDASVVREFRITLTPETIAALNAQAYPPGCVPFEREFYDGTIEFEGVTYQHVGIKTKGGCGSARNLDGKPSFKIGLTWDDPTVDGCPEERRIGGQKSLTLNNQVQDTSASHERLGYELYQAMGTPVSRAASVNVYVNDAYYGLYLNVESINRRFLARNFGSSGGMLYEGTYWCDLYASNMLDDDSGCVTREFRPDACNSDEPADVGDDPLTYEPMRDFIAKLDALPTGAFYPEAAEFIDFDHFFAAWAAEAFMGHWDGYNFNIVNNYRFYHDPSNDKWTLIPTGIDQTFGTDLNPFSVNGRIAQQCLQDNECRVAFATKLATVNDVVASLGLMAQSQAIQDQLRPLIEASPGRGYDVGTFDNANVNTRNFISGRSTQITNYLASQGF